MTWQRKSPVKITEGPVSSLKPGVYYGRWTGLNVVWRTPKGLYRGTVRFPLGGWKVPCLIEVTKDKIIAKESKDAN
jgi:hypothetical protein